MYDLAGDRKKLETGPAHFCALFPSHIFLPFIGIFPVFSSETAAFIARSMCGLMQIPLANALIIRYNILKLSDDFSPRYRII